MAVSGVDVLPVIDGLNFLDVTDSEDEQLLSVLGYARKWTRDLVENIVVPNIKHQPHWLLDPLFRLVFNHWSMLAVNDSLVEHISSVPFVSVCGKNLSPSITRVKPSRVINKASRIADLYFDEETRFGYGMYASDGPYQRCLDAVGVESGFNECIAEERIRKYAGLPPDKELFRKSARLLEFINTHDELRLSPELIALLRLPAMKDRECLLPPSQCRSEGFRSLVDGVLGIVSTFIKPSLQADFGWTVLLEPSLLALRINKIIASSPAGEVESSLYSVLQYIDSNIETESRKLEEYVAAVKSEISVDRWFPGSDGGLRSPESLFFQNAEEFQPHLSNIPRLFKRFEKLLIQFGISQCPSPQRVLSILWTFPRREILGEKDLNVIVCILEWLSQFDEIDPAALMIPDMEGRLNSLEAWRSDTVSLFAHPRVPKGFASKYGIPLARHDLPFIQHINSTDIFNEYCQEEQISTRIANALNDYSLSTSFNEFVANAEDCGTATRVMWFLDPMETKFPAEQLLCQELKEW